MKKSKITYDPEADALYIEFSGAKSVEQERFEIEGYIDYDKDGHILGIEILNVEDLMISYHPKFREKIKQAAKEFLEGKGIDLDEMIAETKKEIEKKLKEKQMVEGYKALRDVMKATAEGTFFAQREIVPDY